MARSRRPISERSVEDYLLEYETTDNNIKKERTCKQRLCRCCVITWIIIFVVALLIFIVIFVALPLIFMHSIELQRHLVFERNFDNSENEFTNFRKYGINGAKNKYVDVNTADQNITLGVWHILPLALVHQATENEYYSYEEALRSDTYPVLLYFHGTSGNRIRDLKKYQMLRRFFHIIAFDYRSYGDSTEAELFEELVFHDCIQMYKWLSSQTEAQIFVWGHSLGTAISTNAIAKLHRESIVPTGLFLEAPFTTLREELSHFPLSKFFSWLPWFEATILDPLDENGFLFKTNEYILSVDCPIMVMHAQDDHIVPYFLGEKLVGIARDMRVENTQGNVTFRRFQGKLGFGHDNIYQAIELPDYIIKHIAICRKFGEE